MNLIIDQGNSSVKIAIFDCNKLLTVERNPRLTERLINDLFHRFAITHTILCSVIDIKASLKQLLEKKSLFFMELTHLSPIPLINEYETPETLGKDRLAAAVGAAFLQPESNRLIIDAGTAITFDVITDDNRYLGGNISPGAGIRFRALHDFTGKLPLVTETTPDFLLGKNTTDAILAGVMQGILQEMQGYITLFRQKYPDLSVFLTGRGSIPFVAQLKNPIFAELNLVSIGLNRILTYNVQ
jgi:type III pantothenate kinase